MAHPRRKFFELHAANQNPIAAEALLRIAELYAIEARVRDLGGDVRQRLRAEETLPNCKPCATGCN